MYQRIRVTYTASMIIDEYYHIGNYLGFLESLYFKPTYCFGVIEKEIERNRNNLDI